MNDLGPNSFHITYISENEDGSAKIEVEVGSEEMKNKIFEEGVNFLLIKGILEGTIEDILRWAQRGKQEENTDSTMKRYHEAKEEVQEYK